MAWKGVTIMDQTKEPVCPAYRQAGPWVTIVDDGTGEITSCFLVPGYEQNVSWPSSPIPGSG